jgi:phosphonate transport system ATP-binding protein
MTNSSPLLAVNGLNKIYESGVHALKDVSFAVQKGEFLVIIGLSGSGKSTLLRCLNRMHEPTTGTVQFLGQDVTHIQGKKIRELRTRMAMIFQNFNLIPRHSVISNVLMGRLGSTSTWRSLLGLFTAADRADAQRYLELVGIAHKAQIRADQLSGGQQQRVAIARALMQKPDLLLADEPVASLDPATCHVVMDYLKKVNEELGITVIANLHFLSLVRQYASRVIALKEGQVVFAGDPKNIDEKWFRQIYGENAKEVHVD